MNKIYAFGCSNTAGYGLDKTCPNNYSWANVIANLIKPESEFINYAKSGCSNKYIWQKILNQNISYSEEDLVIIMWTYETRWTSFRSWDSRWPDHDVIHTMPTTDKKYARHFYENCFSLSDGSFDFWLRIDHISKTLPCKIINTTCVENIYIKKPDWVTASLHCPNLWSTIYDKTKNDRAEDKIHMGKSGHKMYAHKFYEYLKEENLL